MILKVILKDLIYYLSVNNKQSSQGYRLYFCQFALRVKKIEFYLSLSPAITSFL